MINSLRHFSLLLLINLITLQLIGKDIIQLPNGLINPDVFIYLSTASRYFQQNSFNIHDALTVGPVIPIFFFIINFIIDIFNFENINHITIAKTSAIFMYSSLFYLFITIHEDLKSKLLAGLVFTAVLRFIPKTTDMLSFNGELFCAVLIIWSLYISINRGHIRYSHIYFVLLTVLVFYTKAQAAPIALLGFYYWYKSEDFKAIILLSILVMVFVEFILNQYQLGYFYRITDYMNYIGHGSSSELTIKDQLLWTIYSISNHFPVFVGFFIFNLVMRSYSMKESIFHLLYFACIVATITIPGKQYHHYLLLIMPYLALFSATRKLSL